MSSYLWIAMNGADAAFAKQAVIANNLANVNTTGFRAQIDATRALPVEHEGLPTRVYTIEETPAPDLKPGPVTRTGRPLDIAVNGRGWIAVQAPDGKPALTRNGNLTVNSQGVLETAAGNPVLGTNGQPITVPPMSTLQIGHDGTVSGVPQGAQPDAPVTLGRIELVNPTPSTLYRSGGGLFRSRVKLTPDPSVTVTPRALEGSNVSAVDSMVKLIQASRSFDTQIRLAQESSSNAQADAKILQI